jgi:hypothetical protein
MGVWATAEPSSGSSSPPHPAINTHAIVAASMAFNTDAPARNPKNRVREVVIALSLTA